MSTAQRILLLATLTVGAHVLLLLVLPDDGRWIEAIYAQRIYPLIGPAVAFVPSRLPFSLAAVMLSVALVLAPCWLGFNLLGWRRGALGLRCACERTLAGYALVAACAFHGFYFFWGYNYLRPPIEQRLGLEAAALTAGTFDSTAARIVDEAVAHRVVVPDWDAGELDRLVDAALARALRELEGRGPPVVSPLKADWPRGLIARMGGRGVISPLTLEPHIDFDLPAAILPFAAAHEKAHLAGMAAERDANFVAWYALVSAGDARLRYAGYLGVIGYFLTPSTRGAAAQLEPDLAALRAYAARRVSRVVQRPGLATYRIFLRANRVESGLGDYGRVAGLIHAWLSARGLPG